LVGFKDDDCTWAVVATSPGQAKSALCRTEWVEYPWVEYLDLRCRIVPGAAIADLDNGTVIYGIDGLKRGCYDYVTDWCPYHPDTRPELVRLWMEGGRIVCDCRDGGDYDS
jgi:hypothetical protein